MGSFNEICALSGLSIQYRTPVRLLFLGRNPYGDKRGTTIHHQWFVRTPPVKGVHDGYGGCDFDEGPIPEVICKLFSEEVVERPFGFNDCHEGAVTKSGDLQHFINAAWQGRLVVGGREEEVPSEFPTWRKVRDILKASKLAIQEESNRRGTEGFNAQPVMRGVVAVHFNDYGNTSRRLKKAGQVLAKYYDFRALAASPDDLCLLVVPKGAFDKPETLFDEEKVKSILSEHPGSKHLYEMLHERQTPVLAVLVREDVWQIYCNAPECPALEHFVKRLRLACELSKKDFGSLAEFKEVLAEVCLQTGVSKHLTVTDSEEVLLACAELARVEVVMHRLQQVWHIPCLGSQECEWELRGHVSRDLTALIETELEHEREM